MKELLALKKKAQCQSQQMSFFINQHLFIGTGHTVSEQQVGHGFSPTQEHQSTLVQVNLCKENLFNIFLKNRIFSNQELTIIRRIVDGSGQEKHVMVCQYRHRLLVKAHYQYRRTISTTRKTLLLYYLTARVHSHSKKGHTPVPLSLYNNKKMK